MSARGIIRIKCVDLANWASMHNLFNTAYEDIKMRTEGMDTVLVYVQKTDTLENLLKEMSDAMQICIDTFGPMSEDILTIMRAEKAILDGGTACVNQNFRLQMDQPVPPFIEVKMTLTEDAKAGASTEEIFNLDDDEE